MIRSSPKEKKDNITNSVEITSWLDIPQIKLASCFAPSLIQLPLPTLQWPTTHLSTLFSTCQHIVLSYTKTYIKCPLNLVNNTITISQSHSWLHFLPLHISQTLSKSTNKLTMQRDYVCDRISCSKEDQFPVLKHHQQNWHPTGMLGNLTRVPRLLCLVTSCGPLQVRCLWPSGMWVYIKCHIGFIYGN